MGKRPAFWIFFSLILLVFVLGLVVILALVARDYEANVQREQTLDCLCATNPAILTYAYGTMTAKSWTVTPEYAATVRSTEE
jgi:hypothetical protein